MGHAGLGLAQVVGVGVYVWVAGEIRAWLLAGGGRQVALFADPTPARKWGCGVHAQTKTVRVCILVDTPSPAARA